MTEEATWRIRQKCNHPVTVYSNLPYLIHFPIFSNFHLKRLPFIQGRRIIVLRKISYILGFIFNNYSSFVNPSLLLILCGDGVCICKIKKTMVSCRAVADKLLVKWLPRELWQLQKQRMKVIRHLARRIFFNRKLEYSHTTKRCI